MMLRFCTVTGADDAVAPEDLLTLSLLYPHVEWAILFSPKLEGTSRYPTAIWRERFTSVLKGRANTAIHLCGAAVREFEEGGLDELIAPFGRLQLNFNAKRYKGDVTRLAQRAAQAEPTTIVQLHGGNGEVYRQFAEFGHVEVLYDASGGRGIAAESWAAPLEVPTGYAGGLRPENLGAQLEAISLVAGTSTIWCDIETGVRTVDDRFLLEAARQALAISAPYARPVKA